MCRVRVILSRGVPLYIFSVCKKARKLGGEECRSITWSSTKMVITK